ncbi:MAG: ABC transporter permease subunit [Acholeplasmatales bacterium]|nr:ABC transporter permease subunit [Acholeplasmatales bacterium]
MSSTTKSKEIKLKYIDIFLYPLISFLIILLLWTLLSLFVNQNVKVILDPIETVEKIGIEMKGKYFFKAIFGTLGKSFISFFISFTAALLLSVLSFNFKVVKRIISPVISIFRSIPTAAVILILLLCLGSKTLPIAVAILVVLPLSYQNILSGLENIDPNLIEMASTFKVSKFRQITNIYLPGALPSLLSSIISSFGLNIKVIIAAEVMGLPTVSIGYMILISKSGLEFDIAFVWLVISVLLSLFMEIILKIISRLLMPYKYDDVRKIKRFFGRFKKEHL